MAEGNVQLLNTVKVGQMLGVVERVSRDVRGEGENNLAKTHQEGIRLPPQVRSVTHETIGDQNSWQQ